MDDQEFFDIRFICSICNGEGKKWARTKHGPGGHVTCRKCNGTGMFTDGKGIKMLVDEAEALKSTHSDTIHHITALKEVVTVRLNEVGAELSTSTGHFLIITGGDNHLAVAVVPKGAKSVEDLKIDIRGGKSEENDGHEHDKG